MSRRNLVVAGIAVAFALSGAVWAADEELRRELDRVKKELEDMRSVKGELAKLKRQQGLANAPIGSADAIVENKYGPNAGVTTKQGKLTIGGLVQVWYYTIQNDNLGLFDDITPGENGGGDSNETKDNDGFRIRRTELKFTIDIHENVTVVVMIARPAAAIFAGGPDPLSGALVQAAAVGWPVLLHAPGGRSLSQELGGVLEPQRHIGVFADLRRLRELIDELSASAARARVAAAGRHLTSRHTMAVRLSALEALVGGSAH